MDLYSTPQKRYSGTNVLALEHNLDRNSRIYQVPEIVGLGTIGPISHFPMAVNDALAEAMLIQGHIRERIVSFESEDSLIAKAFGCAVIVEGQEIDSRRLQVDEIYRLSVGIDKTGTRTLRWINVTPRYFSENSLD